MRNRTNILSGLSQKREQSFKSENGIRNRSFKADGDITRRQLLADLRDNDITASYISVDPVKRIIEVEIRQGDLIKYADMVLGTDLHDKDFEITTEQRDNSNPDENMLRVIYHSPTSLKSLLSKKDASRSVESLKGLKNKEATCDTDAEPAKRLKRRKSMKLFNLQAVDEQIAGIIELVDEQTKRSPEVAAAIASLLCAKQLFKVYSDRMIDTPFE